MLIYLQRFQYALFILFAALMPAASSIQASKDLALLIAYPIRAIARPFEGLTTELLMFWLVTGLFLLWVTIQRKAIVGEPFTSYVNTLPLPENKHWNVHLKLTLVANHLIWIFFISALGMLPFLHLSFIEILTYLIRIGILFLLITSMQISWLFGTRTISLIVLAAGSLLILLKAIDNHVIQLIISMVYGLASYYLFHNLPQINRKVINALSQSPKAHKAPPQSLTINRFPIITIYRKLLFQERIWSVTSRIIFALIISTGFGILVYNRIQNNIITLMPFSLAYLAWLAFFLSTLFSYFYDERKAIHPLLLSLPIKRYYWLILDSCIIYMLVLIAATPYLLMLWTHSHIPASELVFSLLFLLPLIFLLYPIRNFLEEQSTVAAVASCLVWLIISYAVHEEIHKLYT